MSTITVNAKYIDLAQQLMDAKSTCDDINSGIDMINIKISIQKLENNHLGSVEEAKELHEQLIRKYYSIKAFNNAVITIEKTFNMLPKVNLLNESPMPINKQYIETLKIDSFGIVSDVLVKHQIVNEVKEIIESVSQ